MNKEAIAFIKDEKGLFKGLKVQDRDTKKEKELYADGAFIFVGFIPNTENVKDLIDLNERGFITTTGLGETNINGVFAAGDCREGAIAQVAAATGEGVLASYGVRHYFR